MKSLSFIVIFLSIAAYAGEDLFKIRRETAWKNVPLAGYVEAKQDRLLVTNRMAEVVALPVEQGTTVDAGTVLIQLQDKALQEQDRALQEAEQAKRSVLKQAKLQYDRMIRLAEKGAVAVVDKEAAGLQLQAAQAGLAEVLAQQKEIEELQAYLLIRANAPGQLTELKVSQGDTAMPGQPLGRFVTQGVRTLKVLLPAHLAADVNGARWEIRGADTATWVETELDAISATPEPGTSQYHVYLKAPEFLIPNQRIDVNMLLPLTGLFVPSRAVEQRGNVTYVRMKQDGRVARRLVKLGLPLTDGRRQVFAGLQAGDEILIGEVGHE